MGNFLWRLSTCVNRHARNAFESGVAAQVEIILTDWGSEDSLSDALSLSESARRLLTVVRAPAALAAKYNRDAPYSFVHAVNAAARRASGEFILFCDSDGYLQLEGFQRVLAALRENRFGGLSLDSTCLIGSRRHVPKEFHSQSPSLDALDRYIALAGATFAHDQLNLVAFGGNAAAYLWRSRVWDECRGFDETLIQWGWFDIDLILRLGARYQIEDLERLGVPMYHLEHYAGAESRRRRTEMPRVSNVTNTPTRFAPNPPDWGLAAEPLLVSGPGGARVRPAAPAADPTPEELAYFELQKTVRMVYLMTVTIERDPEFHAALDGQRRALARSRDALLELTSQWPRHRPRLAEPAAQREVHALTEEAARVIFEVFHNPDFQVVWRRKDRFHPPPAAA